MPNLTSSALEKELLRFLYDSVNTLVREVDVTQERLSKFHLKLTPWNTALVAWNYCCRSHCLGPAKPITCDPLAFSSCSTLWAVSDMEEARVHFGMMQRCCQQRCLLLFRRAPAVFVPHASERFAFLPASRSRSALLNNSQSAGCKNEI